MGLGNKINEWTGVEKERKMRKAERDFRNAVKGVYKALEELSGASADSFQQHSYNLFHGYSRQADAKKMAAKKLDRWYQQLLENNSHYKEGCLGDPREKAYADLLSSVIDETVVEYVNSLPEITRNQTMKNIVATTLKRTLTDERYLNEVDQDGKIEYVPIEHSTVSGSFIEDTIYKASEAVAKGGLKAILVEALGGEQEYKDFFGEQ